MKWRHLAWLVAALCFWSCRSLPPPAPPLAVTSGADLVSRLQAGKPQVKTFAARGRLTLLSPQRNYAGTSLIKGRLPVTVRADVLDVLGRSLLKFYTNGREVKVLSPKEGKLYLGEATPGNLAAFIPPAITLSQTLRLMVGNVPLSPGPPDRWAYEANQGRYLLEWRYPDGGIKERLWLEARELQPVKDEWHGPGGKIRFTAEFSDFGQLVPGLPGKIILKTPQPQVELRLVYNEFTLNPALKDSDLVVTRPPAVSEVRLK
ncbi:MAG: hypothetical protein PHU44_05520 [Syntrophales bacterium]|nr:hypothetical protein [Syntrophales bacterium]MDD5641624.1 hypothetical protein [Syntrophales bacterium]